MQKHSRFYVNFPFRGKRKYVHSASLGNYFAGQYPEADYFEIVIKEWMDCRVVFTPVDVLENTGNGYVKVGVGGTNTLFTFAQDKAHHVQTCDDYDEDSLIARSEVSDKILTCLPSGEGSFFDRLIAANKMLINTVCQPNVKLIASKITTRGFWDDNISFQLVLTAHVGTRIFKTKLLVDQKDSGEVIFYGK